MPIEREEAVEDDEIGTRWAVLVAGSNGYANYRHQVSEMCYEISPACAFRTFFILFYSYVCVL